MSPAELLALADQLDLTDGDVNDLADRLARRMNRDLDRWRREHTPDHAIVDRLIRFARRHNVNVMGALGATALANRLTDRGWWRQALRRRFRIVEQAARLTGAVHRRASPYVSSKALRRHERRRRQIEELMAAMEAVNLDTGETIALQESIERSQANPANRRRAMMARIKGIERDAIDAGHVACMVAITAPGRMHARREDGRPVPHFNGQDPRQVQAYLRRVWACATRQAKREGLQFYGLRTVEPHHDGTPHWHILFFAPPDHMPRLLEILRAHALADSPDEPGAAVHRFNVEHIDPSKGSALAYVAKYVSKSIDGEALDDDTESDASGRDAAHRIVAWARAWGIRQFQFFGQPPITPLRELYRHDGQGIVSEGLSELYRACKANDYAACLQASRAHGVDLACTFEARPSARYPGETTKAIRGLLARADDLAQPLSLVTRSSRWAIQPRPATRAEAAHAAPRTRINNSARAGESRAYSTSTRATGRQAEVRAC